MKKPFSVLAATLLAGAMFASSISPTFAEETPDPPVPVIDLKLVEEPLDLGIGVTHFTDVPPRTELAYAVQFLYNNGIAHGYETTFGVKEAIKRVDFAVVLGTYMAIDTNVPNAGFRDLPTRATMIVSALKHKGIVNGKTTTYFGAGDSITRGEAAIMLYNAFKSYFHESEGVKNKYTDVSSRYAEAVRVLHGAGIIRGMNETKFGTNDNITRGQFALLIHRIYKHEQALQNEEKSGFVAFGDSNTEGKYFEKQYPAYLDKQWTDQVAAVYGDGLEEKVYNAGVSGEETNDGMKRFKEKVLDVKPQSVTIMFGINDALLYKGQPQVDKERFKENLTYMVEQLRLRDTKVILMTNTPVVEKTYYDLELSKGRNVAPSYAQLGGLHNWINSYNDIVREVANDQFVPLVDTHNILVAKAGASTDSALIKSGFLDDVTGIHMTPKANDIIAAEVKAKLSQMK